jgi:hypothetical protein
VLAVIVTNLSEDGVAMMRPIEKGLCVQGIARALVHMLAQGDCDCFEGRGVRLSAIQAVESNL